VKADSGALVISKLLPQLQAALEQIVRGLQIPLTKRPNPTYF
jgi:hypothetical protein